MTISASRRRALALLGMMGAAAALPLQARASTLPGVRFGYTAMTWGQDDRQAIDDIAALGFAGIQFRNNVVKEFKPDALRALLQQKGLAFAAMSSGTVDIDADPAAELAQHLDNARYLKACGGQYLQLLDKLGPYGRPVDKAGCEKLGRLLTDIGKATADIGVTVCYHNHLDTLSEKPEGLEIVLASSDPRYVKFELDTAHAVAGGADPARLVDRYHDRLTLLHLKDVVDLPPGAKGKYPFQFVELGRGRVDFAPVFAALERVGFNGWAVIELDRVPEKSRTPKESAAISKAFLQSRGFTI